MDSSPYSPLRPSSEGPNPLRPYYRPPSIGIPASDPSNGNSSAPGGSSRSNAGSGARNILSGLSYEEVVSEASGLSGGISFKSLLDDAVWKYSSVFMAQPFELAKMVLQVRLNEAIDEREKSSRLSSTHSRASSSRYHDYNIPADTGPSSDSDSDEPSYFTSAAPNAATITRTTPRRSRTSQPHLSSSGRPAPDKERDKPEGPPHRLALRKPDSLTEVLSQLWSREGSWGVWKGTNVTFLYSLLLRTIETWTRSMLAAVLNLPDPGLTPGAPGVGGLDIIDSPSPLSSLGITVAAAGLAAAVLAPLDIARTRLMLTPTTTAGTPRSIIPCLRQLSSWTVSLNLVPATLLHATIPSVFSTTTPLVLRNSLKIDPLITPASYSVCTFLSAAAELFVRLPVETVLRRGQVNAVLEDARAKEAAAAAQERSRSRGRRTRKLRQDTYGEYIEDEQDVGLEGDEMAAVDTVVPIGPYTGVIATMWRIARDEGEMVESPATAAVQARPLTARKKRRGQGVQGLWRGWRVGWWGLVGVWGAAALGGAGGKGGEF